MLLSLAIEDTIEQRKKNQPNKQKKPNAVQFEFIILLFYYIYSGLTTH